MIYTVTANPSIDYYMEFPGVEPGALNRATQTRLVPGGKGINVSLVLARLGVPNCALGFTGGETGLWLSRGLRELGCESSFIDLPGVCTRVNVKLLEPGRETECNAPGPHVPEEALAALGARVDALSSGDVLAIGGASPKGAGADYYARLVRRAAAHGARVVVDTAGEALRETLSARPWLVKPNAVELAGLIGRPMTTLREVMDGALAVQRLGARNVLVSVGEHGALLFTEKRGALRGKPPHGTPCGTVGAGDSMVAGFLAGFARTGDLTQALQSAVAAGSAAVFCPWLAERAEYERCLRELPEIVTIA